MQVNKVVIVTSSGNGNPGAQSRPDLHSQKATLCAGTGDNIQVKTGIGFHNVVGTES